MHLLVGGTDPLATDTVGAALLGFDTAEVRHLALCRASGPGQGDLDRIEVANRHLFEERRQTFTCELLDDTPPDVTRVGLEAPARRQPDPTTRPSRDHRFAGVPLKHSWIKYILFASTRWT